MGPSCHHCFYGNATIVFLVLLICVSVKNIEVFNVAVEMLKLVPFALLSIFNILGSAMNHKNGSSSSCKVPDIFVLF